MAVDVALWFIIAAAAALVWGGCVMTADKRGSAGFRGGRFGH
jgi:hypothetical protein